MNSPFNHPVALLATANAALALLISFGVDITVEQFGALEAFASAIIALFAVSRGEVVKEIPVGD